MLAAVDARTAAAFCMEARAEGASSPDDHKHCRGQVGWEGCGATPALQGLGDDLTVTAGAGNHHHNLLVPVAALSSHETAFAMGFCSCKSTNGPNRAVADMVRSKGSSRAPTRSRLLYH